MKRLKIAIIGQGRSGRDIHGAYLKKEENVYFEVAAVVEADELRRLRAEQEYPGCMGHADYRELFVRTDIDLVVNASYSEQHYSITKDLLEHHFNVLVEKPFARNYYECCDLINTAKKCGVTLAVFQQTFFAPYYLEAKEIADSGKIGEIKQVSVRFNNLARRWDWQTLQKKMGGGAYNTGPHPIGIALAFLGFDDRIQVAFSKLDLALTSGDGEDYAKMILTAPGRPVVDVEINSTDAFSDYNIKIQGSMGTYQCTAQGYKMKYLVKGENQNRPVIEESLKDEEGFPIYCQEDLKTHQEEGSFSGTAFDAGTKGLYENLYEALTKGTPLAVTCAHAAKIIQVIECAHAQNPLEVKY
ncbi:Gfo/Idh/MocA family protein [Acetatifactor aquisgranensis]|uniref:Gfo/Idh/MocA family protein n=1 Tax=Acetatifactor aquisgranensis TaxID=2941233 RepID=UPI00203A3A27|nr:Gfo/Idh/MocA family oxidoreductase [Acetatifactor aquisgranensis]